MTLDNNVIRELAQSLDIAPELLPHVPELLADLWPLGFASDPVVRLLERQGLASRPALRMLDLGCGKGALAIELAKRFGWNGCGVDLMPEFIQDARRFAAIHGVAERLRFDACDMAVAAKRELPADLVIFGFDSEALGPLEQALQKLGQLLMPNGHVLLQTAWSLPDCQSRSLLSEADTLRAIATADLRVVDMESPPVEWVRAQNADNFHHIRGRAKLLAEREPALQHLIDSYLLVQEEQCRTLEEQAQCVVLLLANR